MKNKKIYKLKSGPKVVLYQDTSKHVAIASLFVNFGGKNKEVEIEKEKYTFPCGMAHFIEHLLIEHSVYGNTLLEFDKKSTKSNGYTTRDNTEFVINSVIDFEEDLIKLINIVNNQKFTEEDIEETKKAIIKEKMMDEDNNFEALNKLDYDSTFSNIKYPNILGDLEDISNINYSNVKKCYDIFYQKENQLLVISGNFKIGEIEKLIKDMYRKINKKSINYSIPEIEEKDEISIKESSIARDVHDDYVRLNYKVNIKDLSAKEKIKLDFYLDYFLSYTFDTMSKTYNELVKSKTCIYDIDFFYHKIDDFFIIKIGNATNFHQDFIEKVKKAMKDRKLNKEDFEIRKKRSILNILLRSDSLSDTVLPFIDNIIMFDYYDMDTVEDIENESFEEYENMINKLDFTNYSITKMLRKDSEIND